MKKIKHKEISGKIIGISEEQDKSKIDIAIDGGKIELETKMREYNLGENVNIDVNIEVNSIKKSEDK